MGNIYRLLGSFSNTFSAGAAAAFLISLLVWFCGAVGFTESYHIRIAPKLTTEWLFPHIIYGGLWGFIFNFPFLQKATIIRGIILSLIPASFHLFVIYPIFEGQGVMGTRLGDFAPLFVLSAYICWGIGTSVWLRSCGAKVG